MVAVYVMGYELWEVHSGITHLIGCRWRPSSTKIYVLICCTSRITSGALKNNGEVTASTDITKKAMWNTQSTTPQSFYLIVPQSRFGDKTVEINVVCPHNRTAVVLQGIINVRRHISLVEGVNGIYQLGLEDLTTTLILPSNTCDSLPTDRSPTGISSRS